jgi:murein tripeptide amidase MpaA
MIGRSCAGLPIYVYKLDKADKHKPSSLINCTWQPNSTKGISSPNRSVVVMARQHPGETQSSFILEGMVRLLTGMSRKKNTNVFHFIPMVNVEGVILGNYRTNAKGYDLNRNWRSPAVEAQPEVVAIKKYLQRINKENEISLVLDLHGHSRAFNSFFYGVDNGKDKLKENVKLFPYFCSKKMKQIAFVQCCFNVSEAKKNTARAVLSEMFPKALIYVI